jgi:hypothetical protein
MIMATRKKRRAANPSRRKSPSRDPHIRITYDIVTPESAAEGDYEESGWINKDGVSMKPDKYDTQDGITAVDKAIKFLDEEGANDASSSHFYPGIWYTSFGYRVNHSTGAEENRSYHLEGFTEAEGRAIFKAISRR